jgi:hypothetical protein
MKAAHANRYSPLPASYLQPQSALAAEGQASAADVVLFAGELAEEIASVAPER